MNGQRWRKAGAAAALSLALAAPSAALVLFGDDDPGSVQLAVEFYHAEAGEFFVTASPDESEALEAGSTPGWERTGLSFYAVDGPAGAGRVTGMHPVAVPVCRYFIPPASHFVSGSASECAAVAASIPGAVLETEAAFYAWLPDDEGRCPRLFAKIGGFEFAPVYRMWDSARGNTQRLTTSKALRDAMAEDGWIAEGSGADGVAMCVPSWTAGSTVSAASTGNP